MSQNVVILGVQGSGKTVFLSVLGHAFEAAGALGLQLTARLGSGTAEYVRGAYRLMQGENKWPMSTNLGERRDLVWDVKRGRRKLFSIESLDCAGEEIVAALAPEREGAGFVAAKKRTSRRKKASDADWDDGDVEADSAGEGGQDGDLRAHLRARVAEADVVCLFVNPYDFETYIEGEGDAFGDPDDIKGAQKRSDDMGRLLQTFLDDGVAAAGKRVVVTVTQSGRPEILRRIEELGGAGAYLFDQDEALATMSHVGEAHVIAVSAVNEIVWKDSRGRIVVPERDESGSIVAPDPEKVQGKSWVGKADGEEHFRPTEYPRLSAERSAQSSGLVEFLLAVGGPLCGELKPLDEALHALRELQFRHAEALRDEKSAKVRLGIAAEMLKAWKDYAEKAEAFVSPDDVPAKSRKMTETHLDEEEGRILRWIVAARVLDPALREAAAAGDSLESDAACERFRGEIVRRANEQLEELAAGRERRLTVYRPVLADDLAMHNPWLRAQAKLYRENREGSRKSFEAAIDPGERADTDAVARKCLAKAMAARGELLEWVPPSDPVVDSSAKALEALGVRLEQDVSDAKAATALADRKRRRKGSLDGMAEALDRAENTADEPIDSIHRTESAAKEADALDDALRADYEEHPKEWEDEDVERLNGLADRLQRILSDIEDRKREQWRQSLLRLHKAAVECVLNGLFDEARNLAKEILETGAAMWKDDEATSERRKLHEDILSRIRQARARKTLVRRIAASVLIAAFASAFFLIRSVVDRRLGGVRGEAMEQARANRFAEAASRMRSIEGVPALLLPRSRYVDEELVRRWESIAPFGEARRAALEQRRKLDEGESAVVKALGSDTNRLDALSGGTWTSYAQARDKFLALLPEDGVDPGTGLPSDSLDIEAATDAYRKAAGVPSETAKRLLAEASDSAQRQANRFRKARSAADSVETEIRRTKEGLDAAYGKDERRFAALSDGAWRKYTNDLARAEENAPESAVDEFGLPVEGSFVFGIIIARDNDRKRHLEAAARDLEEVSVSMRNSAAAYALARDAATNALIALSRGTTSILENLGEDAARIEALVAKEWGEFRKAEEAAKAALPPVEEDKYGLPSPVLDFRSVLSSYQDIPMLCSKAIAKRNTALSRLNALLAEEHRQERVNTIVRKIEKSVGFDRDGWKAAAEAFHRQKGMLDLPGTNDLLWAWASVVATGQGLLTGVPEPNPSETDWRIALDLAEELKKNASSDEEKSYAKECLSVCRSAAQVFDELSRRAEFSAALAETIQLNRVGLIEKAVEAFARAEKSVRLDGERKDMESMRTSLAKRCEEHLSKAVKQGLSNAKPLLNQSGLSSPAFRDVALTALERALEAKYPKEAPDGEVDWNLFASDIGAIEANIVPLLCGDKFKIEFDKDVKRARAAGKNAKARAGAWSAAWIDRAEKTARDSAKRKVGLEQWNLCRKAEDLLDAAKANPHANATSVAASAKRVRDGLPMLVRVSFANADPISVSSSKCETGLGAGPDGATCAYLRGGKVPGPVVNFVLKDKNGMPRGEKQAMIDFSLHGTEDLVFRLDGAGNLIEAVSPQAVPAPSPAERPSSRPSDGNASADVRVKPVPEKSFEAEATTASEDDNPFAPFQWDDSNDNWM